jgi:hypothetical protein
MCFSLSASCAADVGIGRNCFAVRKRSAGMFHLAIKYTSPVRRNSATFRGAHC